MARKAIVYAVGFILAFTVAMILESASREPMPPRDLIFVIAFFGMAAGDAAMFFIDTTRRSDGGEGE